MIEHIQNGHQVGNGGWEKEIEFKFSPKIFVFKFRKNQEISIHFMSQGRVKTLQDVQQEHDDANF